MGARSTVALVDDLRSFVDGRSAEVARTSAAGVELLDLWLDDDLGEDDTIWPVVEVLERAAFEERPFDIGVINVHSANPVGAAKLVQVLRHWGYRVQVASGSTDLKYFGGPAVDSEIRWCSVRRSSSDIAAGGTAHRAHHRTRTMSHERKRDQALSATRCAAKSRAIRGRGHQYVR